MAVIDGLGAITKTERIGRRAASPGAGFSVPAEARADAAAPSPAAAEVSLGGLLALQEGELDTVQDRAARRHGRDLLDAMASLQHALLRGPPSPADARQLAALAAAIPPAADPRLRQVLEAIGLRAAVELARLERQTLF
jgi:hypothetical protein